MLRLSVPIFSVIVALSLLPATAFAQRGGGQRGGGGMQGGGGSCMRSGGNSAAGTGMMAGRRFQPGGDRIAGMMSAFANANRAGSSSAMGTNLARTGRSTPQNQQPTPQQFTQAAMRMDRDSDNKLCREELTEVANAVIAELKRRPRRAAPAAPFPMQRDATAGDGADSASVEMTETFVTRCLQFDKDNDGALNVTETRLMAAALIRTLG